MLFVATVIDAFTIKVQRAVKCTLRCTRRTVEALRVLIPLLIKSLWAAGVAMEVKKDILINIFYGHSACERVLKSIVML